MTTYAFLHRALRLAIALWMVASPSLSQTTGSPPAYQSLDLVVKNGALDIGGTLLVPTVASSEVLVVLSSGSGWQDRDSTLFGFPLFKVIAEHLAGEGIASFRYDDRGVGTSTGDFVNSTLDDLTADLQRIMAFFAVNSEYPYQHFVLLGHSQGGIVAAKAANQHPGVRGLVLAASPGVTIGELIGSQTRQEYSGSTYSTSQIEGLVSANNHLLHAVLHNQGIDAALKRFRQHYAVVMTKEPNGSAESASTVAERIEAEVNNIRVNYGLPSLTSFVDYDPLTDIEALQVPILSLHGGRDHQVSIEQNKDRLEMALLNNGQPHRIEIFDEANHFFQAADTGRAEEYGTLENRFVDGFVEQISAWILTLGAQQK